MLKRINNWSTAAYAAVASTMMTAPALAQDGGITDLKDQGSEQMGALVQLGLILAFGAGVIFLIFGILGLRKIFKEQQPDDKKAGVWVNMAVGIALTVVPFFIALGQGVFGVTGQEAQASQSADWGLGNGGG